ERRPTAVPGGGAGAHEIRGGGAHVNLVDGHHRPDRRRHREAHHAGARPGRHHRHHPAGHRRLAGGRHAVRRARQPGGPHRFGRGRADPAGAVPAGRGPPPHPRL
ncbi:MAG: hypothetical protein AVDCRST_MAG89-115, partial [uncultured Gemmatimonadetes bacterium]